MKFLICITKETWQLMFSEINLNKLIQCTKEHISKDFEFKAFCLKPFFFLPSVTWV